jgi:hypothetical protein
VRFSLAIVGFLLTGAGLAVRLRRRCYWVACVTAHGERHRKTSESWNQVLQGVCMLFEWFWRRQGRSRARIYRRGYSIGTIHDSRISEARKPHFSPNSLSLTGLRYANTPWSDQPPNLLPTCGYMQRSADCNPHIEDVIDNSKTGSLPYFPNENEWPARWTRIEGREDNMPRHLSQLMEKMRCHLFEAVIKCSVILQLVKDRRMLEVAETLLVLRCQSASEYNWSVCVTDRWCRSSAIGTADVGCQTRNCICKGRSSFHNVHMALCGRRTILISEQSVRSFESSSTYLGFPADMPV